MRSSERKKQEALVHAVVGEHARAHLADGAQLSKE